MQTIGIVFGEHFSVPIREELSRLPVRNFFSFKAEELTMDLAERKCTTYRAGSPPLTRKETIELLGEVPGWSLNAGHLNRNFELPDAG